MTTKYRAAGDTITFEAGTSYTKGAVYMFGAIAGVALDDYVSGDDAVFATEGVFGFAFNASDTAVKGALAYYDASAAEVVDTPINADDLPIGVFWEDTTGTTVNVKINEVSDGPIVIDTAAALDLGAYAAPHDLYLTVDTSGGALEIELPSAANMRGRRITVVRGGTGVNAITLDQNGSETINGSGTAVATLDAQHDTLTLQSNGVGWIIVASIIA